MTENTIGLDKDCVLDWNLDETGCLMVYGSGNIPDFSCGRNPAPPWQEEKDRIRELHISEGITEIGIKAFEDCQALERVYLPDSLGRICAYAFRNCCSLMEIQSERSVYRYIYDESPESAREAETIYFGLEAFKNTPWALKKWGDFYCEEGVLYICFSRKQDLVIPEGVHTLHEFSLCNQESRSVALPKTLTTIEGLVFSGSGITSLEIPDSVAEISQYAFADSSLESVEFPASMKKTKTFIRSGIMPVPARELAAPKSDEKLPAGLRKEAEARRRKEAEEKERRIPDMYRIELIRRKEYGEFREVKVTRRKAAAHRKNGAQGAIYGRNHISVGEGIYRRIRQGNVLLCVEWKEDRLISVKSFAWSVIGEEVREYRMYPIQTDGEIGIWKDSFEVRRKEDFLKAFGDTDGKMLAREGKLRITQEGKQEEWFRFRDAGNFGGPLELELLECWKKEHPQIRIDLP